MKKSKRSRKNSNEKVLSRFGKIILLGGNKDVAGNETHVCWLIFSFCLCVFCNRDLFN
jgi:hypothetical protein